MVEGRSLSNRTLFFRRLPPSVANHPLSFQARITGSGSKPKEESRSSSRWGRKAMYSQELPRSHLPDADAEQTAGDQDGSRGYGKVFRTIPLIRFKP
jgi:hypothetical protein